MKDFLNSLNCFNYEFRNRNNVNLPSTFRTDFLFNTQIETVEDADLILMVGVNTRTEAPVLNSRILKTKHRKNPKVYNIGTQVDLTYEYEHLGSTARVLEEILKGDHAVCQEIKNAKLPMMIVGRDALTRKDSEAILKKSKLVANELGFINSENGWNGYNVLNRSQGEINALELGI